MSGRFGRALIVSRTTIVLLLLVLALLLVRSYQNLEAADPGFDAEAYDGLRPERARELDLYLSLTQIPAGYLTIAARARGDQDALRAKVRSAVRAVDPELPILVTSTVSERYARANADVRQSRVLAAFGMTAFVIAAIGIFAVAAHTVSETTREIGVRMALGGSPRRIAREMLERNRPVDVVARIGNPRGGLTSCLLRAGAPSKPYGTVDHTTSRVGTERPLEPLSFCPSTVRAPNQPLAILTA